MDPDQSPNTDDQVYGRTERQIAFKLLAAHAMVDADFYQWLRKDPRAAARSLHIMLEDEDVEYIQGTVNWEELDRHADAVRAALETQKVIRSIW